MGERTDEEIAHNIDTMLDKKDCIQDLIKECFITLCEEADKHNINPHLLFAMVLGTSVPSFLCLSETEDHALHSRDYVLDIVVRACNERVKEIKGG